MKKGNSQAMSPEAAPEKGVNEAVVGMDPGLSGGLAALSLDGKVLATRRMPVTGGARSEIDGREVSDFLYQIESTHIVRLVVIEKVGAMPKQGITSAFVFGHGAGKLQGVVEAAGLALEKPSPQTWMKAVLVDRRKGGTKAQIKQGTIDFCRQRWPGADLKGSSSPAAKDFDGIADALALAEYGRRLIVGGR